MPFPHQIYKRKFFYHKAQLALNIANPVELYKYHPSITLITEKIDNQNKFSFKQVSLCDIVKKIKYINTKKSSTINSIPPKVLKISSEATAIVLLNLLNGSLENGIFPYNLKLVDITPIFEKKDTLDKTNYRQLIFYRLRQNYLKK